MEEITKKKKKSEVKDWLECAIFAIIIAVIMYFVSWPVQVSGTSMEPTFYSKDRVMMSRALNYLDQYKTGDFIVFDKVENGQTIQIIKRIIGVPGEHIVIKDNKVFINNNQLNESYLPKDTLTSGNIDLILKSDEYYVLGDNRGVSLDSRISGPILKQNIVGKIIFQIYPLNKIHII